MQNVSSIQRHPDTLIKNFMIAGLSQRVLQQEIFPKNATKKKNLFGMDAEVLFSLYEEPERMNAYLEQIFPERVSISQTSKIVDPKFFTFMSVDYKGFNQYNHVLIFHERFTESLIHEDFDENACIEQLVRQRERGKYVEQLAEEIKRIHGAGNTSTDVSTEEEESGVVRPFGNRREEVIAATHRERVPFRDNRHLEGVQKGLQRSQNSVQELKLINSTRQTENRLASHKNLSRPGPASRPAPTFGGSNNQLLATVSETETEHAVGSSNAHKSNFLDLNNENNYRDSLYGQTKQEVGQSSTSFYKKGSRPSMIDYPAAADEGSQDGSFQSKNQSAKLSLLEGLKQQNERGGSTRAITSSQNLEDQATAMNNPLKLATQITIPENIRKVASQNDADAVKNGAQKVKPNRPSDPKQEPLSSGSRDTSFVDTFNPRKKGEYYFTPIAFVIQTDVEHHDIFKEILLALFESIRKPDKITEDDKQKDRYCAFADFLCHVAFLGSIPCPTFNTRYHVEFYRKTLTFQEPNYSEIPDKNQIAIKVLFSMLDVRSIIYCWKAILFDATLVLISSQYSLQFYIAQALLQLLFPLAFQGGYVQPGRNEKVGLFSSPIPIIFACSHHAGDFEYFEMKGEEIGRDNVAICDIDGSFTNNLKFPELEDEKRMLRSLSALKNFRGAKSDSAFEESYAEEMKAQEKNFAIDVRYQFYGVLNQFLKLIPEKQCFRDVEPDEEKVFIYTFNSEKYLDWFEDTGNYEFAKRLITSQMFATFVDNYFDKDISNMLIYMNITSNGFDFEADETMKIAFQKRMDNIEKQLVLQGELAKSEGSCSNKDCIRNNDCDIKEWPKFQKIDFCWRMPQDCQRVMIFEKLEYAVQSIEKERRKLEKEANQNLSMKNQESIDGLDLKKVHEAQMEKLAAMVRQIKQLFKIKLKNYADQLTMSNKNIPDDEDKSSVSESSNQFSDVLDKNTNVRFRRLQTFDPSQKFGLKNALATGSVAPRKATAESGTPKINLESIDGTVNEGSSQPKQSEDVTVTDSDMVEQGGITPIKGQEEMTFDNQQEQIKKDSWFKQSQDTGPREENYSDDIMDNASTYDIKAKFWQLRSKDSVYFYKNRIVEICYGHNGLISFLDLLFTQFPTKDKVKNRFNYYFSLKKQLEQIEEQIELEIEKPEGGTVKRQFDWRNVLEPETQATKDKSSGSSLQTQTLKLEPTTSIVFKTSDGEVCFLNQLKQKPTQTTGLWEYDPLKSAVDGELGVFAQDNQSSVWMLPVLPKQVEIEFGSGKFLTDNEKLQAFRTSYQYIYIKQKLYFAFEDQEEAIMLIFREFLLFSQRDRQIFPQYRFYELLEIMTYPQKERILKALLKGAGREMFQLKLMFEHEVNGIDADKDEPCSLDHTLFDQDYLAIPPPKPYTPQSKPAARGIPASSAAKALVQQQQQPPKQSHCMQKRKPNNSECDKKGNHSSKLLLEKTKKMIQKDRKGGKLSEQLGTTKQISTQGSLPNQCPLDESRLTNKDYPYDINMSMAGRESDVSMMSNSVAGGVDQSMTSAAQRPRPTHHKTQSQAISMGNKFDVNAFNKNRVNTEEVCYNPEKRVKKLLTKLINLYMTVFDASEISSDDKIKFKQDGAKVTAQVKEELLELRCYEVKKLNLISFDTAFASEANDEDTNDIKHCFWLNLFNYKMLSKILEVLITKPKVLKNLTNCTMFVAMMISVEAKVNGEVLNCYEIFKTMLMQKNVKLLQGNFDEPVRQFEEMPKVLQELAVSKSCQLSAFGVFMPIRKWSTFTIYEKDDFRNQLRKVAQNNNKRFKVSPENFLIQVPKFFKTVLAQNKESDDDLVEVLKQMIEQQIIPKGPISDSVKQVISQIEKEKVNNQYGAKSNHIFEIDSFWWRFDLTTLRNNIKRHWGKSQRSATMADSNTLFAFDSQCTMPDDL